MRAEKKTFVAFDQFQRYETISKIINYQRRKDCSETFRILELGANEHKDMKVFLPDDEILFTDIVLTESMQKDPDFLQVDGTSLPFEDASFDFVFAADVFEHIPHEKRDQFLSEAVRVAKRCAILSFPFQSEDIVDAEDRVNSYYKAISGQDFLWLQEHKTNGLPNLKEVEDWVDHSNLWHFSFFHGDIRTWEKMWYCHFNSAFSPETLAYRTNIDHYYNCKLYEGDVSDSCYRVFYVVSQTGLKDFSEFAATLWKKPQAAHLDFLNILLQTQRQVHSLYEREQMQAALLERELCIQKQTHTLDNLEKQLQGLLEFCTQVYFDTGDGFHEGNSVQLRHAYNTEFDLCVPVEKGTVACRVDPAEESVLVTIKRACAVTDTGICSLQIESNGIAVGNAFIYETADPQMWFPNWREDITELRMTLNVMRITPDAAEDYARQQYMEAENREQSAAALAEQEKQLEQYRSQQELDAQVLAEQREQLGRYQRQQEESAQVLAEQTEQLGQYRQQQELDAQALAEQKEQLGQYQQQQELDAQALAEQKEQLGQYRRQQELDAQVLAEQTKQAKQYRQQYEAESEALMAVKKHCAEVEQELAHYQEHYLAAINQREELKQQLALVQNAYNVISNAFFWKITKPFRFTLDGIKSLLYGNRYTALCCKGLRCWRENGFAYTWRKVKEKQGHRVAYQEYQDYTQQLQAALNDGIDPVAGPRFSILVPLYNTPERYLREMITSVINQSYTNWELCLADGSTEHYVEEVCREYAQGDARIRYMRLAENRGISGNSNACADMADGEYLVLLDHDDVLPAHALIENAKAILETQADVLYSDEDHLTAAGTHTAPFFKPDWSPDLLYSQMYICHLLVIRRELFIAVGGFRPDFDGSQDYDLMLRLSEKTDRICHIPEILYFWRESETSTAANADAKPYAHIAGKRALNEHLNRKYGLGAHAEDSAYTFVFDARFALPAGLLVSIIIPMKDKWEMTAACVQSILDKSSYQNFEILLLDNRSEEENTKKWLKEIPLQDHRVRVIAADMEFNWSKLNNFGVSHACGDVFIFLNNDTQVISEDWMERLSENAWRNDIGVVGALLLYPDQTIQHAGVVVGIGDWADHIFKGMQPSHYGSPYVSPMVSRNVLAVTGACLAVSRRTWDMIGAFDEEFIICGSDVEYGIRAYEHGLFNRYDVNVQLYHLESKSRDSYIPEIDFQKSYAAYTPYRENVDPFFNVNLDKASVIPMEKPCAMDLINFKNYLKHCPLTAGVYQAAKNMFMPPQSYVIPEIGRLSPRRTEDGAKLRLNLLIPSVDQQHVFGGIATAISFFQSLQQHSNWSARILVTDTAIVEKSSIKLDGYSLVDCMEESDEPLQLIGVADRYQKSLPVSGNDVFIATGWWTAYVVADVIRWQAETYGKRHPLVYLIQDYEPGFYPWSSRYLMADSTYRMDIPTIAVMNSSLLEQFFEKNQYHFEKVLCFEPHLNASLQKFLPAEAASIAKKKQILVYGRPSVARNAFELIVYALKTWCSQQPDAADWTVLSAGERHDDVDLGGGIVLHSVGKLSLEEYAKLMLETYAGISLMVSPHPSYPPLEMAAFGIRTITNCYSNKDLASFSENIISLQSCSPLDIANKLCGICLGYTGYGMPIRSDFSVDGEGQFDRIVGDLKELLNTTEK